MRNERIKAIFDEARRLVAREQDAYVRAQCAGDAAMEAEVLGLLKNFEAAGDFLGAPPKPPDGLKDIGAIARHERPGSSIGRYKLVELIGEGGFGSVFLAEQLEPVRRTVALKIIKLGMDTRQVIARFEHERQALALMDHPNIAKVLDAGATDTGRPYFVMELVRGEPLTQYCDARQLGMKERLEVFVQVCHAVQHAHQKGIIHRDLKPSNILVTIADDKPVPKVIDFGIAKATGPRLTDKTLFTDHRAMIGTPEYMSPEQAEMGAVDIDTRTDIYSLGVLLYELLTGVTPFDPKRLRSAAWGDLRRIICEVEPPKPSTRLSTMGETLRDVAVRRDTHPGKLRGMIRGDLDWIVMKCLEKDRSRRYESASGLAADVERHLRGEPVMAAPPSTVYRVGKFVRRHRGRVAAGSLVGASLLAAVVGTTTFAVQAQRRAEETMRVAEFQAKVLSEINVSRMGEQLREDLLAAAKTGWERLGAMSSEEMDRESAKLRSLLAETNFTGVALKSLDRNIFERAMELLDKEFAAPPFVKAQILLRLGDAMQSLDLMDHALGAYGEALRTYTEELGSEHPNTLTVMSRMVEPTGSSHGKWREAEALARKVLAVRLRVLLKDAPDTLWSREQVGYALMRQQRLDEAELFFREALEGLQRVAGDSHEQTVKEYTVKTMFRLGQVLYWRGDLVTAEPLLEKSVAGFRDVFGEDHLRTLVAISVLAKMHSDQGRLTCAEQRLRDVLQRMRRELGDGHRETWWTTSHLGDVLRRQGQERYAEAEPLLEDTVASVQHVAPDDVRIGAVIQRLGLLRRDQNRLDEGEVCFRDALEILQRQDPDDHRGAWPMMLDLADVLTRTRDVDKAAEADELQRQYLELHDAKFGLRDAWRFKARRNVASNLYSLGKPADAEPFAREAVVGFKSTLSAPSADLVRALGTLALIMRDLGEPDKALALFDEIDVAYRDHADAVGQPLPEYCWYGHADCLMSLGCFREAESVLLEALSGYAAKDEWLTGQVIDALIKLHDAWHGAEPGVGHDATAKEWRARRDASDQRPAGASPAAGGS